MPRPEPTKPLAAALRFGPALRFELQPAEGRLLVDGHAVPLGRRALDLLAALTQRPGHLFTKSELLEQVWPGLVVEEANLQMQVSNLRKVLGGEAIATVPGRGYRFVATLGDVVQASTSPLAPEPASGAATPRLIGRDDDLQHLESLLTRPGCVSVVGTAGVGKTSLARVAASRWIGRTAWVDLAALLLGGPLVDSIARAVGLQLTGREDEASAQLLNFLQSQSLLLVLDNAEHLIDPCAALAAQLATLPDLRLLVTSQAALSVSGERVLRLGPLAATDAPTLLAERIAAVDHRFAVTPGQAPLLRAVCAQLDGLPLALEMAAARVPLLGLRGVHDALAERFALLTRGMRDAPARHHTLHDALDWSYRLLGSSEQRLFSALGVFADGFTLELAMAMMADGERSRWDLIDGLATLADRSLLVVGPGDLPRYRLLETLRAFALEQLARSSDPKDDLPAFRRRHAEAVLALFEGHTLHNPDAQARCLAEMENAREALAWAGVHDLGIAVRLSARITIVTTFTVWRHESGNWLIALEPQVDGPTGRALPAEIRAAWWTERARTASIRRDASAGVAARRAVALWEPLQQPRQRLRALLIWVRSIAVDGPELAEACAALAAHAATLPDLPPTERMSLQGALARAALIRGEHAAVLAARGIESALASELGNQDAVDAAESSIVNMLGLLGRREEAVERGLLLLARIDPDDSGDSGNLPFVFGPLLSSLVRLGRLGEARALLPRVIAAGRRFATPVLIVELAALAAAEGRSIDAARLIGHARASYEARGMTFEPEEVDQLAAVQGNVALRLGESRAQAEVTRGRELTDDDAEALALRAPT